MMDRIREARADLFMARQVLTDAETKASESGNYLSYTEELARLRSKVDIAEARLAYIEHQEEEIMRERPTLHLKLNGGD
jgi:hypothetical protein